MENRFSLVSWHVWISGCVTLLDNHNSWQAETGDLERGADVVEEDLFFFTPHIKNRKLFWSWGAAVFSLFGLTANLWIDWSEKVDRIRFFFQTTPTDNKYVLSAFRSLMYSAHCAYKVHISWLLQHGKILSKNSPVEMFGLKLLHEWWRWATAWSSGSSVSLKDIWVNHDLVRLDLIFSVVWDSITKTPL